MKIKKKNCGGVGSGGRGVRVWGGQVGGLMVDVNEELKFL